MVLRSERVTINDFRPSELPLSTPSPVALLIIDIIMTFVLKLPAGSPTPLEPRLPHYPDMLKQETRDSTTQCKNQIDTRGNGSTTKKDPANGLNPDLFVSKPSNPVPNSDALPVKF